MTKFQTTLSCGILIKVEFTYHQEYSYQVEGLQFRTAYFKTFEEAKSKALEVAKQMVLDSINELAALELETV